MTIFYADKIFDRKGKVLIEIYKDNSIINVIKTKQ